MPLTPDEPIDATRLALRLEALGRVLDDLPGQARRFARWRNRVAAGALSYGAAGAHGKESPATVGAEDGELRAGIVRRWPLRMGRPPGWRRKGAHEVYEVLANTHGLALWALAGRDTS